MNKLKIGDIVVVVKHRTHSLIGEKRWSVKATIKAWNKRVPINLVTEVGEFGPSNLNIISTENLAFSIEYLILRKATLREQFLYYLEGKPFIKEE